MAKKTLMSLGTRFSGPGGDWIMLASESDLRAYVLRQHLGITNILMLRSNFDENLVLEPGETPYNYAVKTADEKARIVADRVFNHEQNGGHNAFRNEVRSPFGSVPDDFDFDKVKFVIGADTVCWCKDEVFGKPKDRTAARDQLRAYQKYDPVMVTGVSIYVEDRLKDRNMKRICSFYERTLVHFTDLSNDEIEAYLDTGEYKGVAGSCNYTALGETLVQWVEGSYTAAVGIPTHQFAYEICSYLNEGTNLHYLVADGETGALRVRARGKRSPGDEVEVVSTAPATSEEETASAGEEETEELETANVEGNPRAGRRRREAPGPEPELPEEQLQEGQEESQEEYPVEVVPARDENGEQRDEDEQEGQLGKETEENEMKNEESEESENEVEPNPEEENTVRSEEENGRESDEYEGEEEDEEDEEEEEEGENEAMETTRAGRGRRSLPVELAGRDSELENFEGSEPGDNAGSENLETTEEGIPESRSGEVFDEDEDQYDEDTLSSVGPENDEYTGDMEDLEGTGGEATPSAPSELSPRGGDVERELESGTSEEVLPEEVLPEEEEVPLEEEGVPVGTPEEESPEMEETLEQKENMEETVSENGLEDEDED
ncbi:septum formation MAF, putative [Babesia ovata]|uniref:Septum formation MAF, putative n=1 Tax=Babesia ovata TaxID=189622 RepID=A0A2H6K6X8_9APIC|nr:septum formation MAF, putative [Babesia ovata]GBE58754.1 septum formation MAF, putative [Babesia ovata]